MGEVKGKEGEVEEVKEDERESENNDGKGEWRER